MYKTILRVITTISLCASMVLIPQDSASAALKIATTCKLTSGFSYTVAATLSGNGLIYVALADAGSITNLQSKARIIIHVVNPNTPTCKIIATYIDTVSYNSLSELLTQPIARTDSAGNVYIGKSNLYGFRTIFIPATAPITAPLSGLKVTSISGLSGNITHGGMAVTDNHVLMMASKWVSGQKLYSYYAVLPVTKIRSGGDSVATWRKFSKMAAYGPRASANDSVEGLPDGTFYMAGSFEHSNPKFTGGHIILNPTTMIFKGAVTKIPGKVDLIPCNLTSLLITPYGCFYPSARLGADGNLYLSYGAGDKSTNKRMIYAMKYNTSTKTWTGISGSTNPDKISVTYNKEITGTGIAADLSGNAYFAGTDGWNGSMVLAQYANGKWNNRASNNVGIKEFGKPAVLFAPFGSGDRLSVFLVSLKTKGADIYWTTYK